MELRITSCQAEIAEPFCCSLADYLHGVLRMPCVYVGGVSWRERERLLLNGDIHLGWVCGLAYVSHDSNRGGPWELGAAPVRSHARYQGQPVYFSDVTVRADTPYQKFEDLRGAICAYNEPASHSGCNILRYELASSGRGAEFFGRVIESGSHRNSLRLLRDGAIDVAAIDSSVLELESCVAPDLVRQLRVLTSLGPSPAPPWVAHTSLPVAIRQRLSQALVAMSTDPAAQELLRGACLQGFSYVVDSDYDPIREMDRIATPVKFSLV